MVTCGKVIPFVILALGILGAVIFILGFVFGFSSALDGLINNRIESSVRLENGTEQFERWAELPFPLHFKVYAFDVLNPNQILEGAVPIVKEVGPFVYNQYRRKENIQYDELTDTYTYTQRQVYEFNEELSALSHDDNITVLNIPLQGIFLTINESVAFSVNVLWNQMFGGDGYFLTLPAKSLFFEGYQFCETTNLDGASIICIIMQDAVADSKTITYDGERYHFSFFGHKNNSDDGFYNVSGGNHDINTLGEIISWESTQYLNAWNGENSVCNRIRGRDSSIYPPFNNESSNFDVFNTDICRIVNLKTDGTTTYKDIEGIVSKLDIDEMANDGDKECYCITQTLDINAEAKCLPKGFADMQSCLAAPILASFPHMLWADDTYASTVTGLQPDPEKHQTFVVLEPNTGTPLQGAKRMQFNAICRPITNLDVTQELRPSVFPVLWVEEGFNLPDEQVQQLKDDYFRSLRILDGVSYALIGVGAALMVICILYFIFRMFCNK